MPAAPSHRSRETGSVWFDTGVAQALVADEQRDVIPLLTSHIGVRGLYLRAGRACPSSLSGNMLQSTIGLHRAGAMLDGDLRCEPCALPIENDALCMVYALHALDVEADAGALLDEIRRVLRPDGVLFLLGLSPTSGWRLRWLGQGLHARGPTQARRLLHDAGLSVDLQVGIGPILCTGRPRSEPSARADRSLLDPLRAGYLLIARKRRATLTPIGTRARAVGALQPQARAGAG